MSSKPENVNPSEPNGQSIPPSMVGSQPWWRVIGYNAAPSVVLGEKAPKSSLEPVASGMETKTSQSQDGNLKEGASVSKETQTTIGPQSDGNYGHEHNNSQHAASTVPTAGGDYLIPNTQLELVGHSIACAPYAYSDPYYGGLMTAYGTQALVSPHLLGMHHPRMPLPLEMAEEPVYVNAKQYHGILRRRQSRAKAELEKKLIKVRKASLCARIMNRSGICIVCQHCLRFKPQGALRGLRLHRIEAHILPYLHESRHQHAMRRARGCGGRFLNTKNMSDAADPTADNGVGMQLAGSSITEAPPTLRSEKLKSYNGQEQAKGHWRDTDGPHPYSNGNGNGNGNGEGCYQHHQGFRLSAYHPITGERGEEGDRSCQQRGSISVSRPPHRALAIQ